MAKKPLSYKDFLTVDYAPGQPELVKRNAKKRKSGDTDTSAVGEDVTESFDYVPKDKLPPAVKKVVAKVFTVCKKSGWKQRPRVSVEKRQGYYLSKGVYLINVETGRDSPDSLADALHDLVPWSSKIMKMSPCASIHPAPTVTISEGAELNEFLNSSQRRKKAVLMRRMEPRIKMARQRALKRSASTDTIEKRAKVMAKNLIFMRLSRGKRRGEVSIQRRMEIEKRMAPMTKRMDKLIRKLIPRIRKIDQLRKQGKKPPAAGNSGAVSI